MATLDPISDGMLDNLQKRRRHQVNGVITKSRLTLNEHLGLNYGKGGKYPLPSSPEILRSGREIRAADICMSSRNQAENAHLVTILI